LKFRKELRKYLDNSSSKTPHKGIKVGILVEGFPGTLTDPNVATASKAAVSKLAELGAEVHWVSIPL
jgi:amidase